MINETSEDKSSGVMLKDSRKSLLLTSALTRTVMITQSLTQSHNRRFDQ